MSTTKEEAQKLYEGKYFYEIVKDKEANHLHLYGPMDTIRYVNKEANNFADDIEFAQIIDGQVRQVFTKQEILVTDRIL